MRTLDLNKRKAILQAGISVFADDGYHTAKIAKIAELAGVATGSIYRYYPNKEAIIVVILEQLWEQLADEVRQLIHRTDLQPVEKLELIIDQVFDIFTANPSLAIIFVNEHHQFMMKGAGRVKALYDAFLDSCEQIVREGVARHIFNANVDIKIFRHYIIGAFRHLLQQWTMDPEGFPLNKLRQNLKFIIKNGIMQHAAAHAHR
ncbi:MAG TPA: TetR/AcrR family transcriptional regulator [Bacteroidota bacterium]|nr:TetR/AcrR family transcriptional regulator [Bacteroidota bacterium]